MRLPDHDPSRDGGPATTDSDLVLEEVRAFEIATHRVWLNANLDTRAMVAALLTLFSKARVSLAPELSCGVVEFVSLSHMYGEDDEARFYQTLIEESLAKGQADD